MTYLGTIEIYCLYTSELYPLAKSLSRRSRTAASVSHPNLGSIQFSSTTSLYGLRPLRKKWKTNGFTSRVNVMYVYKLSSYYKIVQQIANLVFAVGSDGCVSSLCGVKALKGRVTLTTSVIVFWLSSSNIGRRRQVDLGDFVTSYGLLLGDLYIIYIYIY